MAYLQPNEYATYCGDVAVSVVEVAYASGLIDSIIGRTLQPAICTEVVKLRNNKGKLRNYPVVVVNDVKAVSVSISGYTESDVPLNSVYITDNYGHFAFFPGAGINTMVWGAPDTLKVQYSYGYSAIPEDIKIVCGTIAKNIVKLESIGGLSGAKSIASLDFNIAMFDDRLFSSNEALMLQKYKVV